MKKQLDLSNLKLEDYDSKTLNRISLRIEVELDKRRREREKKEGLLIEIEGLLQKKGLKIEDITRNL